MFRPVLAFINSVTLQQELIRKPQNLLSISMFNTYIFIIQVMHAMTCIYIQKTDKKFGVSSGSLKVELIFFVQFYSKAFQEMKISKKTLSKWEFQEQKPKSLPKKAQNSIKNDVGKGDIGTVFGLPQCVIKQSKLAQIKSPTKPKKSSYESYLQSYEVQAIQSMQREYCNQLKHTLNHKTKELFRSMKKHRSVIDSIKIQSQDEKMKMKISKKAPISSEHTSQKALSILEKIILKEVDFYANKKKTTIELQASKLPIIQFKQSKRKQSLAAYEARSMPLNAAIIKYESLPAKSPRGPWKSQKQKPYFSGWDGQDVNQPNDF